MAKRQARSSRKKQQPAENPPALPCANAASLKEEEIEWLWNLRIAQRNTTMLVGPSEVGKSTVATAIVAAVTAGIDLPGGPGVMRPRAALWYASEENVQAKIIPRLRANGAKLSRVFFPELSLDGKPRARPRLPRDAGQIIALAQQADAGIIIFDPITSYCEDGANPDHAMVARPMCEMMKEIAEAIQGVVLPIKHPKKFVPGGSYQDQISGSKEWFNVPRGVLLCAPHPDDEARYCLIPMKASDAEKKAPALCYRIASREGLPMLLWEEEANYTKDELMDVSGSATDRDTLADAKMILVERLREGDAKVKDLLQAAQDAGITPYMLRKAKKLLKASSHTIGPVESRYHVWRAPPGGFPKEGA